MKRIGFVLLIAVLAAGTVFAHDRNSRQNKNNRQPEIKSLTIEGTLQLEKGFVAVASGETVYLVPLLTRYIGFIEGLKEGKKVVVEGYGNRRIIHPKKVTIDEKSYDFFARVPDNIMRNNYFGPGRGYGQGRTPQDYLDEFSEFIKNNINTIAALKVVCTRPRELTRESLKNLRMELGSYNFT